MNDRFHVDKAADAGAHKSDLLQRDPSRYMLRSVGAGMALSLVVFVFWALMRNLLYSTMGNMVGGVLFVGLPFSYLNPREREEQLGRGN